jgi:hypothetical protein
MKSFVLITRSESSDYYHYLIKSETTPSSEKIKNFLEQNAQDKDGEYGYERVFKLIELDDSKFKLI